jgi:hypothetical protein
MDKNRQNNLRNFSMLKIQHLRNDGKMFLLIITGNRKDYLQDFAIASRPRVEKPLHFSSLST